MKNNIHTNPLLLKMVILVTCFLLVILYNKSYATATSPLIIADKGAVRFQANAEKHELTVTFISKGKSNEMYQLFIFTTDGVLVEETSVNTQDITTIKELKRGYYLYELFDNDIKLKSGLFTME